MLVGSAHPTFLIVRQVTRLAAIVSAIINHQSSINYMPLYEFRCQDCGIFDEWRTMNESNRAAHCPNCQELAKRIFSIPGIQLNGALRLTKTANPEPRLVNKTDTDPQQRTRVKSHGGRPWMINH
jgi:putative FmdB family regulatory protein